MPKLYVGIALMLAMVMLKPNLRAEEPMSPFHLGHRASDDLPPLSDEESGTAQQQALLTALAGDPYGHRGYDHCQTGCSMLIRKRAIPSNTWHYDGYWVGGGRAVLGDDPYLEEGTFGWDYFGILFNKHVALGWSHGRHYQGGTGRYKTDGPHLIHK